MVQKDMISNDVRNQSYLGILLDTHSIMKCEEDIIQMMFCKDHLEHDEQRTSTNRKGHNNINRSNQFIEMDSFFYGAEGFV